MIKLRDHIIIKVLQLILAVLFFVAPITLYGQQRGTVIKDNSSTTSSSTPNEFAVLELNSNQKGFLLPRMSTVERNSININQAKDQGLAIFNTTIGCIEYYNTELNNWVSLCGETLPAEVTILPNLCSEIKVTGDYYQNHELEPSNGILVKVLATKAGTYNIHARSANGYSFEAKGKFPTTGTFTVFLKGDGKPRMGYDVDADGKPMIKGDKLTITVNNKPTDCEVYVFVNKDMPIYSFISTKVNGRYFTAEGVTSQETITVKVNVTRVGKWSMKTDNVQGITFYGEGAFTSTGEKTVTLKAQGQTLTAGDHPIEIISNSLNSIGGPLVTAKTTYKGEGPTFNVISCQTATFSNDIYTNELIPIGTTSKFKIRVLAPGRDLTIRSGFKLVNSEKTVLFSEGGINFQYDRNATGTNANVQELILTVLPNNRDHGTSNPMKREMYFFVDEGFNEVECTTPDKIYMEIKSRIKPTAIFNSPFTSVEKRGVKYIPPYTNMATGNTGTNTYLTVKFYAGGAGTVDLETNTVNGIKFSGSIPITNGIAEGKIYATGIAGKPIPNADSKFTIKRKDTNTNLMDVNIDFVYRRMKVVSYGRQLIFTTDISKGSRNVFALLTNKDLIGWDGDIRVDGLEFLDPTASNATAVSSSSTTNAEALKFSELMSQADIVTLTGLQLKSNEKMDFIYTHLNRENFVFIYTERYSGKVSTSSYNFYDRAIRFIRNYDNSFTGFDGYHDYEISKGFKINKLAGDHFSLLYENTFLDKYPSGMSFDIEDALFGYANSGDEGDHSFRFKKVPAGFSPLHHRVSSLGTSSDVTAVVHNTKGIVIIGNHRPFYGVESPTVNLFSPVEVNFNTPRATEAYGQSSSKLIEVYNAYHFLNLMHWSIDYAQKNRIPK